MKDLFLNTQGLYSEDLTTEILKIILEKDEYASYQRLFYNYLLGRLENKSTKELGYEIRAQESYLEGRPDIVIAGKDSVFIIENKFFASFSGGNQITRYQQIIDTNFKDYSEKRLFVLTIDGRKAEYQNQLVANNESADFLIWEEILRLFESDNFLIQALTGYIEQTFLIKVEFTKELLYMLQNKNTAEAINNVSLLIDKVKPEFLNYGLNVGSSRGSSINYKGYYLDNGRLTTWFGYGLQWWLDSKETITPIFLQIRKEFTPNPEFSESFVKQLEQLGFYSIAKDGFIKPYSVELFTNSIELVKTVCSDIIVLTEFVNSNNLKSV